LRRGFKTEANGHAVSLRRELELDVHAPLCPWKLAGYLEIPIVTLSSVAEYEPAAAKYLMGRGKQYFSAVTIFVGKYGRRRVVFHNDKHAPCRQAANLAHELAHAILCHPPTPPFEHDPVAEEEASWMGPTLLVSNEAALHIVTTKLTGPQAQQMYNISPDLLQMRLNVSGARIRHQRRRNT
jgi:hypothetical protein